MEAKNYNFEREKCIGRGTYGKVYLCFYKNERQKKFAMKVIDLEGLPQDERNMAEKEANLLPTLQHKYILHALTTFQENETLCIVTEFCDHGDLEQFLNKRKGNLLEERQIVEWFRQICSALEYLHGRNILHRDIKTQNIFLTGKEMTIRLGDLGWAKVLECSTQKASTFCGSPHYLSPEILACKPYNSKSDIWAMGVCVYEMATLERPFDASLHQELYLKIKENKLPPLPKDKYSTQLIMVIERMLCRNTDYRPTATELLQDVLFKNQKTSKRITSEEGQFELGELIGTGVFGKKWECFDKKSGKKYLHGKDVLHRNIKTQNIFLTGNEMTAKLGDFGVAKVLESPTQKVLIFRGSPYYMSPEIYAYKPYNSKTYIWAFGVCVYEMVALKLPFNAPQMPQLVYKIIHDELPPLPEGYSQELIEIIEKMMCREMDRRPSASKLLQNALFKNHNFSKVEFFLPNKKTTQGKLSTNEDMDKTISDNTLKITRNAREYDSYFPSRSNVSNSEIITLDPELPEAGGSETSSEDGKSFAGATESDRWNSNSSPPKGDKEENIFQYIKEDCVHEDETGASAISEENWHPSSYTQRQDPDAVLQQEFDEFKEGKENEKDEEERTLMDEKVQRRFQSRENNRKPENVGHGKPRSEAKQKVGLDNDLKRRKTMTPEGGQFELEPLIERGSYGTVFECFDERDRKRKVAMKKINLSKLSKDDRSSAETEARLLTTLQHQYILHTVSTFQEKETLCIETEFCDQGDLEQFLKSRKGKSLEEQRIVEWFRQICSALEYLHGRNVLHRDIRTRNIFLTGKEMTAKLGNFGLAKVLESFNNEDLSVRDSPYYMNPDAFAYIHYNSKTDIWALGVCVYEMVALKLPSDVPDIQQLGLNIFHDKLPPLPNGYSRALIEMLKWMMCRETERRPSALELLQNVLFKNHSASKAFFLPDENTTREKLSTCQDMDKTISNNPEYENNLPSKSTVLNSESFDATTPDTELSNVSGSETSSENFERTMAADRARSTLRPPPSTFTRFRSVLRSFKDWMIGDAGSYEINCATENTDMRSLQDEGKENFSAESREGLKNQIRFWNKNLPNEKHLYKYFWKEHSVFSQWYSCTFTVDEQTYSSAEQYMMHQKAVLMDDEESAKLILALNEPEEIKRIGRHIKNFNQELWEIYCLDVVEKGNMAKFSQNEKLRDELFSTYPKTLVEASPIDRIWGIGLSEKDKRAWNKETWRGQNLLGQILTKVRDKLMEPFLKPVDTEKGLV